MQDFGYVFDSTFAVFFKVFNADHILLGLAVC